MPPRANFLGFVALVCGVAATAASVIPPLHYLSGYIAVGGLFLGVVAYFLPNRKRRVAIAAMVVSSLGVILSVVLTVLNTTGLDVAIGEAIEAVRGEPNITKTRAETTVIYEVTGDSTDAIVSYVTVDSDGTGTDAITSPFLPLVLGFSTHTEPGFTHDSYSVHASTGATGSTTTCRITVEGVVVSEESVLGPGGTVICHYDAADQ
ncbi:MAG TPA: MmpS family transport accessory protein [Glaciihabitans sp.]|jgi:hypothetical protein|nr:MmpS family transport accessory protein [Glaciihabitans sp.]